MFKIISVIAFNCTNKFLNKNLHSHFESEALLKSVMKEMRQTPEGVKSANSFLQRSEEESVWHANYLLQRRNRSCKAIGQGGWMVNLS